MQFRGYQVPIFAFFDIEKTCVTCEQSFVFRGEELRHWVENLRFYILGTRNHCPTCQATITLKKRLSRLVERLHTTTLSKRDYINKVLEISEIYQKIGRADKAKGFIKKEIKRLDKKANDKLLKQLEKAYLQVIN